MSPIVDETVLSCPLVRELAPCRHRFPDGTSAWFIDRGPWGMGVYDHWICALCGAGDKAEPDSVSLKECAG